MSVDRTVRARRLAVCTALGLCVVIARAPGAEAVLERLEATCSARLASGALKVIKTQLNLGTKCRNKRASDSAHVCPDATTIEKVGDAVDALVARASERCGSTCSISPQIVCLDDLQCPPLPSGAAEACSAGAKGRPFDMANLGYPGPFCAMALGGPITMPSDLGACSGILLENTGARLIDALYGGPAGPPVVSPAAAPCLAAVGASARRVALANFKSASKCRANVARGKLVANPFTCLENATKLQAKVERAKAKARKAVIDACPASVLDELPACGNAAGIFTPLETADCVIDLVMEAVDPREVPADRAFAAPALLEAIFPPAPVCGDGVRNQPPGPFLPLGEECDGGDDGACPGACIAPGDVFECTCATVPRMRLFTDSDSSENDSGWTGLSHDQTLGHLSGFVSSLSNCDCSLMENGECVGASLDPICDVEGKLAPRCSWSTDGSVSCANDGDCSICDARSLNAGATCNDDDDCDSQCYDAAGTPTGPCVSQVDCGGGDICRGRCDRTQRCILIPNGSPHPVSAAGIAVCAVQTFRTDLTGTRNLLDGAHELYYRQYSKIYNPERQDRPCPVCGGFCEGGPKDLAVCKGRCSTSKDPCRFDSDCPSGEGCTDVSPDCPNGKCQLALVCGADAQINPGIVGRPCRIDYEDPLFGTPSSDCPPASNISGEGLELDYLPATSGPVTLGATLPCTAPGWELYDCPCPADGGQPTAPNTCIPACTAAAQFGVGCADGGDGSGAGTVCSGGLNDGALCDEDGDCPSGSCSRNPTHCVGDPGTLHKPCTTSAECGIGLCLDACPGGRCVPLCVAAPGNAEEGYCAAGPLDYNCSSPQYAFRTCSQAAASAGCAATCMTGGQSCTSDTDCAPKDRCTGACEIAADCEAGSDGLLGNADDIKGAGVCVSGQRECFLDPIAAAGSATSLSAHDSAALWCFKATHLPAFDAAAGFGGPARVHVRGLNVTNFGSIPP